LDSRYLFLKRSKLEPAVEIIDSTSLKFVHIFRQYQYLSFKDDLYKNMALSNDGRYIITSFGSELTKIEIDTKKPQNEFQYSISRRDDKIAVSMNGKFLAE